MTRFARPGRKTHVEATSWTDLVNSAELPKAGREHYGEDPNAPRPKPKPRHLNHPTTTSSGTDASGSGGMPPKATADAADARIVKHKNKNKSKSNLANASANASASAKPSRLALLTPANDAEPLLAFNKPPTAADILQTMDATGADAETAAATAAAPGTQATDLAFPAEAARERSEPAQDSAQPKRLTRHEKDVNARRLRRGLSKQICFNCRKKGHSVSECKAGKTVSDATGLCYACGSTEHTTKSCRVPNPSGAMPFAMCFVCRKTGHLSKFCPDNPRGMYPDGGSCTHCTSVRHLAKDCPDHPRLKGQQPRTYTIQAATAQSNPEDDGLQLSAEKDADLFVRAPAKAKAKTKVVKF
ncbi:hypothetical protein CAOG_01982 [Capsaspora owczarzaki ATCC 30864]|uniref:CCHC-type domain-containing protein n=1 Tax=Capsaspora owczarzaki (strain ATCC 30864) TaxID=595528 RepID=A0A0D2WLH9_CAPO3|nr:hypothetical protein CAOG_01982 [Capsaspora owczarzaki ATCC 30864]KJE90718.1 hypothetical protein CAOG_001982 [Capsaspora owczarzaki ATCC 30864]|eukprot:XP_004364850.1 hypothetical protein CAOG_01982 [Capsaspora owczarzaki ATCC 30864]